MLRFRSSTVWSSLDRKVGGRKTDTLRQSRETVRLKVPVQGKRKCGRSGTAMTGETLCWAEESPPKVHAHQDFRMSPYLDTVSLQT